MNKPIAIDYKFYENSMRLCDFTVQAPFDRRYKFHYSCYKNNDGSLYLVHIPYGSDEELHKHGAHFLEINKDMLMENITKQTNNKYIATVSWVEKDRMKVVKMNFPVDLDHETIYENVIRHLQEDYNQIITEENIHLSLSTEVHNAKAIN